MKHIKLSLEYPFERTKCFLVLFFSLSIYLIFFNENIETVQGWSLSLKLCNLIHNIWVRQEQSKGSQIEARRNMTDIFINKNQK